MTYPFTDRVAEDDRLFAQGCLFDPLTRRVLLAAGAWTVVPSGPGE
ncbi:MAG TPA: hypothetical protein VMI73_09730 [Trebonia sp.]|nr:hypothetical protein [Trebonia sp.]